MKNKTIYFAHPYKMMGSKEEVELLQILKDKDYTPIDPFSGEEEILKEFGADNYYCEDITDRFSLGCIIWDRDIDRVIECDSILVWCPIPSTGTAIELWEAFLNEKEIIIISESQHPAFAYVKKHGGAKLYKNIEDFKNNVEYEW